MKETKRYVEVTVEREIDIDGPIYKTKSIVVDAWVYPPEPEQRHEKQGQPPHPGCDAEVEIISAWFERNGADATLTAEEEEEAKEKILDAYYDEN